jgi:hypothetical protein
MAERPHDDRLSTLLERSVALRYKSAALCRRAANTLVHAAAAQERASDLVVQRLVIERRRSSPGDGDDFDSP